MPVAIATVNEGGSIKTEVGSTEIACCARARNGHSGASIISCVTSYFLLHASDFGTTAVIVAPKHMGDLKLLPPKLHNELKPPIDRTISVLGRINAPPHNQHMA
jgi:hypothetical protein